MRFFAIFLATLVLMFGATYWLLFTASGNNILKPYIEKKIEEVIDAPFKIERFRLKVAHLDVEVLYQNSIRAGLRGDFSIFSKTFDMKYSINGEKLVTPTLVIDEKIDLNGELAGSLNSFIIKGGGVAFEAPLGFSAKVDNKTLTTATVNVKDASIEKLLGLASQPLYSKGLLNMDVEIKEKDGKPFGDAKISLVDGVLNEKVLKEEFGVELGEKITYKTSIDAAVEEDFVKAKGVVDSSLAKLFINDAVFNIKNQNLTSKFKLLAQSLKKLGNIVEVPLNGALELDGELKYSNNVAKIVANSDSFGGDLGVVYEGDKVFVKGEEISLEKLLFTANMPPLVKGDLNLSVDLNSIQNLKGEVRANLNKGALIGKELEKMVEAKWPKEVAFSSDLNADIKNGKVNFNALIDSELAKLKDVKGEFDIEKVVLNSVYELEIEELNKLSFLTKKALKGEFSANGELRFKDEKPYFDAKTNSLGGELVFVFEDEVAKVDAKGLMVETISQIVDIPHVFAANADIDARYDLAKEEGEFLFLMPEGRLLDNELVGLVKLATNFDMTKELYANTKLEGTIKKELVNFIFDMNGKESSLRVPKGELNLDSEDLNAPFELKITNKDLSGSVKGKMSAPKVKISASSYIEQKIKKHVPEEAKDLLKGLKKLF